MHPMFAAHKGVRGLGPLYTPFDQVLETADIITLHAPLMPSTRNMIGLPEFRKMKKRPIIVNTARGGLVDEAALVQALDENLISGVGFDVLTSEPPAPGNPLMAILDRPNVIVTPHVAWASDEAMQSLWHHWSVTSRTFTGRTDQCRLLIRKIVDPRARRHSGSCSPRTKEAGFS